MADKWQQNRDWFSLLLRTQKGGTPRSEHDILGIRMQFDALPDQAQQCGRIFGVVLREHQLIGFGSGDFKCLAVRLGQRLPTGLVHIEAQLRAAFPPAG